jgi:hypothetical protein
MPTGIQELLRNIHMFVRILPSLLGYGISTESSINIA